MNKVHFMSDRQNWETPKDFFTELDKEFHFTLDVAADDNNHKCDKFFTEKENGLMQSWKNERVFCNPPYARELPKWVEKASKEAEHGTLIVMLIPARTDTRYFHKYIYNKAEIRFIKGRLKFEVGGVPKSSAPFPSMLVIFNGGNKMRLIDADALKKAFNETDGSTDEIIDNAPTVDIEEIKHMYFQIGYMEARVDAQLDEGGDK